MESKLKMAAFTIQIKSIYTCIHTYIYMCVCMYVCIYKVHFSFVLLNMYCSYNKRLIILNQLQGFHSWSFIAYCKFSVKYNKSK